MNIRSLPPSLQQGPSRWLLSSVPFLPLRLSFLQVASGSVIDEIHRSPPTYSECFTMGKFKDSSYLFRMAALFVVGLIAFIAIRAAVIPRSFGQYGPYRGKALTEIAARAISYAGHEVCEGCHPDVYELKSKGAHAHVNCESC